MLPRSCDLPHLKGAASGTRSKGLAYCRRLAVWLQWDYNNPVSKTATIRTRIEPGLKREVEDILSQLGLTASDTVQLLYRQIKLRRGLPFEVRIPNALTMRTLKASKAGRNVKRFGSKEELFADLGL